MQLEELDLSQRFTAKVVSTRRVTPDEALDEVKELVLEVSSRAPDFAVGQSIGVLAPGDVAFGQEFHLRLYSVADLPSTTDSGASLFKIAVRRCSYIDSYSGEQYPGIASNYLCNLSAGDQVTLAGPFGLPFEVPAELDANLILIATSTGIAPFRAFVRHLYEHTEFSGRIWLFYGARSGLDVLYLNDEQDDLSQYYDRETFEAFQALSPRPHWGDEIAWGETLLSRGAELARMLGEPKTYVYVAGLASIRAALDVVFAQVLGSKQQWERRRAELVAGKRWVELLY